MYKMADVQIKALYEQAKREYKVSWLEKYLADTMDDKHGYKFPSLVQGRKKK